MKRILFTPMQQLCKTAIIIKPKILTINGLHAHLLVSLPGSAQSHHFKWRSLKSHIGFRTTQNISTIVQVNIAFLTSCSTCQLVELEGKLLEIARPCNWKLVIAQIYYNMNSAATIRNISRGLKLTAIKKFHRSHKVFEEA